MELPQIFLLNRSLAMNSLKFFNLMECKFVVAGRTAQEFNQRKKRKGAFWEDRYHATAVEMDEHLAKCMVYIDLNIVRAGVVEHPSEYRLSGFNEIQNPSKRYAVIDRKALLDIFVHRQSRAFLAGVWALGGGGITG